MSKQPPTESTQAAVLTSHSPFDVLESLPVNVFPVRMRVGISRNRDDDNALAEFSQPDYPVTVIQPSGPYVPDTTMYFDNPARRPPEGMTAWTRYTFAEKLEEVCDHLDENTMTDPDRLELRELDVVEIPMHFVTTDPDTGNTVAKSDLYEKNGEMRIASFGKDGTLSATNVRDQLEDALPGESRTPIRLLRVAEVAAKPSRQGRHTRGRGGRARYYTEHDAEQVDDLSLTPGVYAINGDSRTRPLTPVLSSIDDLLPELMLGTDDLVQTVTFSGRKHDKTVFRAEGVRQ